MSIKLNIKNGARFARLVVLKEVKTNSKERFVECLCDCGETKIIRYGYLKSGHTKSCGCFNKESAVLRNTKHGISDHKLYNVWRKMKIRCYDKSYIQYHNYGGRGIKICKEWGDVMKFFKWAINNGYAEGLQIDRINNNGNYKPSNCRFVTQQENLANRRCSLKNKIK